jgi:hypothetical protein
MLFKIVPGGTMLSEPYGQAPMTGVAPQGFSRGPETYWQGAYWSIDTPSPITNPCKSFEFCIL